MVDRLLELVFDLPVVGAAHRQDGALARADEAGDDRHVVADDVVEKERRLGLIHQGRDMADVDRLLQVDELPALPQPVRNWRKFSCMDGSERGGARVGRRMGFCVSQRIGSPGGGQTVTAARSTGWRLGTAVPIRHGLSLSGSGDPLR